MPPAQPPLPPDEDRASRLLAALWVPVVFMTAFLGARIMVRMKLKNTGIDDWLMVVSLISYVVSLALITVSVSHGAARHIYFISPENIIMILKYNFISQPFSIFGSAAGKISVATFLAVRIMGPVMLWRKRFLFVNTFIYALLSFLAILFVFIQCSPSRALWLKVPGSKCWDPKYSTNVSITQASFGAYFDFMLAFVATNMVWILNMPIKRKAGLSILLSLGVLAGICAAVKTSGMSNLSNRTDLTWVQYSLYIWNSMEQALIIICGSIPTVKPLYDYLVSGRPIGGSRQSEQSKSLGSGRSIGLGSVQGRGGSARFAVGEDDENRLVKSRSPSGKESGGSSYEVSSYGELPEDYHTSGGHRAY